MDKLYKDVYDAVETLFGFDSNWGCLAEWAMDKPDFEYAKEVRAVKVDTEQGIYYIWKQK